MLRCAHAFGLLQVDPRPPPTRPPFPVICVVASEVGPAVFTVVGLRFSAVFCVWGVQHSVTAVTGTSSKSEKTARVGLSGELLAVLEPITRTARPP